jgi:hypothetical protein
MDPVCALHTGEMRNANKLLIAKPEGEDLSINGRIKLRWILKRDSRKLWTECICIRIGTSGVLL